MKLLPVVDVTLNGSTIRLFDNCQTLAAVRARPGWRETSPYNCDDCCPPCEEPEWGWVGDPQSDGAWWADDSTSGALGLLLSSVDLEPAVSSRRLGEETVARPEFVPRELLISGEILGTSYESVYRLRSKLVALLDSWVCEDLEMSVRPFCPADDAIAQPIVPTPVGDREPPVGCWGGCPEAEPLAVEEAGPAPVDSGRRRLMRARFVSWDEEEVDQPLDACYGMAFLARFEVWNPNDYGDLLGPLCESRPLGPEDPDDLTVGCQPHRWGRCRQTFEVEECVIGTVSTPNAGLEMPRSATFRPVLYCQPMYSRASSCLIPTVAAGVGVAPVVMVSTGSGEVSNLRFEIVEAVDGFPAPDTCEGGELYAGRPLVGLAMLAGPIPSGSVLTIDGRSQRVTVDCPTGLVADGVGVVEGWEWPVLDPSRRWWVTAVADCFGSADDLEMQVYYAPRFTT